MEFSILIPTLNNINYLKICINSIKKNSKYNHEILVHSNNSTDETSLYLMENNIKEIKSDKNYGLCTALNQLAEQAKHDFLLFLHDDMYICPNWEDSLINEIKTHNHINFYLTGIMIEKTNGHINYNFGNNYLDFNEKSLLEMYNFFPYQDIQGADKNPSLIHKNIWKNVNGMSLEFNPGDGSDPDFICKLWKSGIRIFKGISNFRVYHFGSITTRKNKSINLNNGSKTFLKKWGFSHKFLRKHYLQSDTKYIEPLKEPNKNLLFYFDLTKCKLKLFYNSLFSNEK